MKWKRLMWPEEGFTLIEIMITLVIMSIGLMALAGLQVSAIRGNAFSKRLTTAISIAQSRLEQVKNTPYANIQSESPTQVAVSNPNLNFTRQVTVTNNSPLPNTKRVEVAVTWTQASKTYTVPISTIISQ